MEQIGERIVKLRKMNNLTQEKLANKLFISNKAVSKWESNKGCPSNEMILRLSEVFNCSTDYLLLGENLQNINIEFDKKYSNEYLKELELKFKSLINKKIPLITYELWISSINFIGIKDKCLYITTTSNNQKDRLLTHLRTEIVECIKLLAVDLKNIKIYVDYSCMYSNNIDNIFL